MKIPESPQCRLANPFLIIATDFRKRHPQNFTHIDCSIKGIIQISGHNFIQRLKIVGTWGWMEELISYKTLKFVRLPISDGRFPVRPGLPVMVLQVPRRERLLH
jgi:hypothetical protein